MIIGDLLRSNMHILRPLTVNWQLKRRLQIGSREGRLAKAPHAEVLIWCQTPTVLLESQGRMSGALGGWAGEGSPVRHLSVHGVSLSTGAGMPQICHTLKERIMWTGDCFKTCKLQPFSVREFLYFLLHWQLLTFIVWWAKEGLQLLCLGIKIKALTE